MKLLRRFLTAAVILFLLASAWFWWNRPKKVDMAAYAPADSLLYLECNSLPDVASALASTDAWKALNPLAGIKPGGGRRDWLRRLLFWTGLGPAQQVILARAQVAVVMVDLGTADEGDTLKIKPDAALVIETHTPAWRIKPLMEKTLSGLATSAYGQPIFSKQLLDGAELLRWNSPNSTREILSIVDGTLLIVGNSERAIKSCLAVHRGQRPSLLDDPEMHQMRRQLTADRALAFGYISSKNAARLMALGAPLLFGNAPGDLQLERFIASSAAKVLGSVGWSSQSNVGGIEDHYLFALQPAVLARLQPLSRTSATKDQLLGLIPGKVRSLTIYKYDDPAAAWQSLGSAIASQLDTLSAVVFKSVLKSSLLTYGISEPERFLAEVESEIVSVRLDQDPQRAILIARMRDSRSLRGLLTQGARHSEKDQGGSNEIFEGLENQTTVAFVNGYVLLGSPAGVRYLFEIMKQTRLDNSDQLRQVLFFVPPSSPAGIITYSNDAERIRSFVSTVARATPGIHDRSQMVDDRVLEQLPYSATETGLSDQGLERRTRSSFGLFSSLVPILFPEVAGNK